MTHLIESCFLFFFLFTIPTTISYEFLALSLLWPISTCQPPRICRDEDDLPQSFTIQGLWPSTSKPPWPENCKGGNLKPQMVKSIVPRLEYEWPNLSEGESDFSLWEREWDRHGKCSLDIFHNQLNYFRTTLMLNTQVDITSILITENKIMPSDTSLYDTQHIVDAITIDFGVPQLECIEESNPPILRAIRLCYGRNLSSIDCPYKRLNINCGVQLKWPSTSSGLNSINSSSGLNSFARTRSDIDDPTEYDNEDMGDS
ncbi:hypothetical protein P8452_49144 [Trifolium repens]|nr:hypothetical protein P8452_49144 [Trifolium repens]